MPNENQEKIELEGTSNGEQGNNGKQEGGKEEKVPQENGTQTPKEGDAGQKNLEEVNRQMLQQLESLKEKQTEFEKAMAELSELRGKAEKLQKENSALQEQRDELAKPDLSELSDNDKKLVEGIFAVVGDPIAQKKLFDALKANGKFQRQSGNNGSVSLVNDESAKTSKPTTFAEAEKAFLNALKKGQ